MVHASGVANSTQRERIGAKLDKFLALPFILASFESEDADHAGVICAELNQAGTPIGR